MMYPNRGMLLAAALAMALAPLAHAEDALFRKISFNPDGSFNEAGTDYIYVEPYPVASTFGNTAWTLEQQRDYIIRYNLTIASQGSSTSYGSRYFENEKSSYPKAILNYIWGVANNNATSINAAKAFLQANDDQGGGMSPMTANVDWFASFTIKTQINKYFYFGKFSQQTETSPGSGVYINYLDPAYAGQVGSTMSNGADLWLNDDFIAPAPTYGNTGWMLSTAGKAYADPLRRPTPYWTAPEGPGWGPEDRNSWVDVRNTDNLKAMREIAAYLMAVETGNTGNRDRYAARLTQTVTTLYRTGQSEWDSENYFSWGTSPFTSLYDYAQDPTVRKQAKADLDFFYASGALKYLAGGFGGPTKRNAGNASNVVFGGGASSLLWMYFGDTPVGVTDPATDQPNAVHSILSSYRPSQATIGLATKNWGAHHTGPVELFTTKPSYDNWADPGAPDELARPRTYETLFYGNTYSIGSCVSDSAEGDLAPFKLLARNATRGVDFFAASSGTNYAKNTADQIAQHRNRMIWLRPDAVGGVNTFQFQAPTNAAFEDVSGVWFFRMADDQTWIAVTPINLTLSSTAVGTGALVAETLFNTAQVGGSPYFGFAMQVGETGSGEGQFATYDAFKSAVLTASSLNLTNLAAGDVTLTGTDGAFLRMVHNPENDLPTLYRNAPAPIDWYDPNNFALFQSVNSAPTTTLAGATNNQAFASNPVINLTAAASDSGQRGPISLDWKQGQLSILAGDYLFDQSVTDAGDVSWSETPAVAADYLGKVVRVEFWAGNQLVGEDANLTDGISFNWTGMPDGLYALRSRAIDNDAQAAWSNPTYVTIGNVANQWKVITDGNWSLADNWLGGTPNAVGAVASFYGAALFSQRTITLDAPATLGQLNFDNAIRYTLAGASTLTFDDLDNAAGISVLTGSHRVNVPLALNDTTTLDTASGASLDLTGNITAPGAASLIKSGSGSASLAGTLNLAAGSVTVNAGTLTLYNSATLAAAPVVNAGTLNLYAANTFTGNLAVNAGTLAFSSDAALGNSANNVILAPGATLRFAGSFNTARDLQLTGDNVTFDVTSGNSASFDDVLAAPADLAFTKSGSGTLSINNAQSFTGSVTVAGGVLFAPTNAHLGDLSNSLTLRNNATLRLGSSMTLDRDITFASGGGVLDIVASPTVTLTGNLAGSGYLTKTGDGTLRIDSDILFTGGINLGLGTLDLRTDGATLNSLSNGTTLTNASATQHTVVIRPASDTTTSAVIAGKLDLVKTGTTRLTLTSVNTVAGAVEIQSGRMVLSGTSGAATGITQWTVNAAELELNNETADNTARISAAADIALNGSRFRLTGRNADITTTHAVGDVVLGPGRNEFALTRKNNGNEVQLALASLAHNLGATAYIDYSGTLGVAGNGNPYLTVAANPALNDGIVGGWITVKNTDFVTYNAATGFQDLSDTGRTINTPNTWTSATNVIISSSVTLASDRTINSLRLSTQNIDLAGYKLNVDTGGILMTGNNTTAISNGYLTAGNSADSELFLLAERGTRTLSAAITDNTAGKVHVAFSTVSTSTNNVPVFLLSSTANTYTGDTFLNASSDRRITLRAMVANVLPATTGLHLSLNGTFDANGFNQTLGSVQGAGDLNMKGATLTTGGNHRSTTLSGALANANLTKTGSGAFTLAGPTFWNPAAAINVQNGSLRFDLNDSTDLVRFGGETAGTAPTIAITAGASLVAAGSVDPFTDSAFTNVHADIINNSVTDGGFNVTEGDKHVNTIEGAGQTTVTTASLTTRRIRQSSLSIGVPAPLPAAATAPTLTLATSDAPGSSTAPPLNPVPEPSSALALGVAALSLLARRRNR